MIVSSLLNRRQLEVELLHIGSELLVTEIFQNEFIGFDDRKLIVVHVNHFLGVFDNWRSV